MIIRGNQKIFKLNIDIFLAWVLKTTHAKLLRDTIVEPSEALNASTFQTCIYLVKVGKPVGTQRSQAWNQPKQPKCCI